MFLPEKLSLKRTLGGLILTFKNSITTEIKSLILKDQIVTEIKSLTLKDKDTDAIVLTFDTKKYSLETCNSIYEKIKKEFPENKVVGIPKGITIEVQSIDNLINYLEECKKDGYLY